MHGAGPGLQGAVSGTDLEATLQPLERATMLPPAAFLQPAVLDWELSTLGHPMADFSYHLMAWRLSAKEFRGLRGVDLAALGIPGER